MHAGTRPALVVGALRFEPPRRVWGWCFLPESPGRRVTVEITIDGQTACAMVAAQRHEGQGDGRHGFSLTLPVMPSPSGTCLIEGRELESGTIFGRVVLRPEAIAERLQTRLRALDIADLAADLPWRDHAPGQLPAAAETLRGLAQTLRHRGDAIPALRRDLARRLPRLRLSAPPAISVAIVAGRDDDAVLASLMALQSLADAQPVELILAGSFENGVLPLLGVLLRGVRLIQLEGALDGAALNLLTQEAQSEVFCLLDLRQMAPPAPGQALWPHATATASAGADAGGMHIGGPAAAPGQAAWRIAANPQFTLTLAASAWRAAGGFEPGLRADAAYADLAEKCALLGIAVTGWRAAGLGRRGNF